MEESLSSPKSTRLHRRWWDYDGYPLRGLAHAIERALTRCAEKLEDARALDFGCGDKPYAALFARLGIRYQSADIEGTVDFPVQANGQVMAPSATFEIVTSFQVLEHVWDIDTYLHECARLLRTDGVLLLSTHGVWLYHPHPGDFRRWTRAGLVRELESRGFVVESVESIVGPMGWTLVMRLLGYVSIFQKIPLLGSGLTVLFSLVMNLRALLEDKITPHAVLQENACMYLVTARKAHAV